MSNTDTIFSSNHANASIFDYVLLQLGHGQHTSHAQSGRLVGDDGERTSHCREDRAVVGRRVQTAVDQLAQRGGRPRAVGQWSRKQWRDVVEGGFVRIIGRVAVWPDQGLEKDVPKPVHVAGLPSQAQTSSMRHPSR